MNESTEFGGCYRGRRVLVTGHTGFKGSWLALWLQRLGANVTGLSLDVPTTPSHFEAAGISRCVEDRRCDLRNYEDVRRTVFDVDPDYVFHLAAQPLVMESYRRPVDTFGTNVMGSVHVLEALRERGKPCIIVMVTSDKCYDNVEWEWGYRETDRLGGKDPYSGSKGAAELAIRAYVKSFATGASGLRVGIGRAGNVIGGGDWAADRVIPDCVRAWSRGRAAVLRRPQSTRPWQHVLEPLSGYLRMAERLGADANLQGEPFNFGPETAANHTVLDVVREIAGHWPGADWEIGLESSQASEAGLLKLNCDKAWARLKWRAVLTFSETAAMTAKWYRAYYGQQAGNILDISRGQIDRYCALAAERGSAWIG